MEEQEYIISLRRDIVRLILANPSTDLDRTDVAALAERLVRYIIQGIGE